MIQASVQNSHLQHRPPEWQPCRIGSGAPPSWHTPAQPVPPSPGPPLFQPPCTCDCGQDHTQGFRQHEPKVAFSTVMQTASLDRHSCFQGCGQSLAQVCADAKWRQQRSDPLAAASGGGRRTQPHRSMPGCSSGCTDSVPGSVRGAWAAQSLSRNCVRKSKL